MNISMITKFGIASVVAGLATMANADTNADLQARIEQAEARIAELTASNSDNWMNDQRAEETRQLVHDVLADADTRASMQGDGSPVTVNVHGFAQFRWSINDTKQDAVTETHGFSLPAVRLEFDGDIYDWSYRVSGQWDDGGAFTLKDAYADWNGFRVGQFKSPFMKEWLTYRADTLTADRSIVAYTFGQGRSQGIQYGYDFSSGLKFTAAYTDGFNSDNGAGVQNGYALTGRLDYEGAWFNLGAAVSHNDLDVTDYNTWTVDASTSLRGFDFTGAYVAQSGDIGSNWATVLTAAYSMGKWQPFVQYQYGELEGVTDNLSIGTFGVNYTVNENIKWTTDLGYSFNTVDAGWNTDNTGWNTSSAEGEYLLRTQLQIRF